jgi:hypothetical protein
MRQALFILIILIGTGIAFNTARRVLKPGISLKTDSTGRLSGPAKWHDLLRADLGASKKACLRFFLSEAAQRAGVISAAF